MSVLENIKNTYKSTVLCLKYPFLYTRNRFNGKHYNNRRISNKIFKLRYEYFISMSISLHKESDKEGMVEEYNVKKWENDEMVFSSEFGREIHYNGRTIYLTLNDDKFTINSYFNGKTTSVKLNVDDYLDRVGITHKDVVDISIRHSHKKNWDYGYSHSFALHFFIKDNATIKETKFGLRTPTFKLVNFDIKGNTKRQINLLEKLNSFLGIFHFLPSITELNAMEEGWRIKFGEDMCREIRNSLLTTYIREEKPKTVIGKIKAYYRGVRHLFSYRIMQIKEKWAKLEWYAYGDTDDTLRIIRKYRDISRTSCIVCGKEAKWHTTVWICPYCDEHKPNGCVPIGESECP